MIIMYGADSGPSGRPGSEGHPEAGPKATRAGFRRTGGGAKGLLRGSRGALKGCQQLLPGRTLSSMDTLPTALSLIWDPFERNVAALLAVDPDGRLVLDLARGIISCCFCSHG